MNKVLDFVQFRTFTHTYFFKVTDQKIVLKVYDLGTQSLKHIWKKEETPSLFADISKVIREIRTQPNIFFKEVQKIIPDFEIPPLEAPVPDLGTCRQYLRQAIEELKSKTITENEASKQFTCPITHEVFKEPVVLGCGHTFEKEALERATQVYKHCPLDRQPITSIASNFGLKSALEEWKKEDPLPTFSSFQKSNPALAQANLTTARAFLEAQEYDQAMNSYKTAFQYTKDSKEYAVIPELYKSLKNPEKERLAWLHYALYTIEEGDLLGGITHLEQAKALESSLSPSFFINFALLMLYSLVRQQIDPRKAKALIPETASLLEPASPKAFFYAQQILLQDSTNYPLYAQLGEQLQNEEEIHQLFLKGVLHALNEGELGVARNLYEKISKSSLTSFEDLFLAFQIYPGDQRVKEVLEKALSLKEKKKFKPARQAFKMLLQHEEKPAYYQAIIDTYFEEAKTEKVFSKATKLLDLYLQQRSYDLAQELSDQVVSQIELPYEEKIEWYKKLETVYAGDSSEFLKDIWEKLGEAYESLQDLPNAEAIYEKAYYRFSDISLFAFKFAAVLSRQEKIRESVLVYYAEAEKTILKQDLTQLEPCYQEIIKVDPQMKHLEGVQKVHLVSQIQILRLTHKVKEQEEQLARLEQKLAITNALLGSLLGAKPPVPLIPPFAFGALKWEHYFGIKVVEPPLPPDIHAILAGPCPIFHGKRASETHLLTLIPEGMTLERLQSLIQNARHGNKMAFSFLDSALWAQHSKTPTGKTQWVLMTNDVLPGSRGQTWQDQQALVARYRSQGYELPSIIDVATSLLLEDVQTGKRFYTDSPYTVTRCQETVRSYPVVVGSFVPAGLSLVPDCCVLDDVAHVGVGAVRKFS